MKFTQSLKAISEGLLTVFSHLFRKPVTEEYPEERPFLNGYFRGRHRLENCIVCGYCQKVCPSNAIIICKSEDNTLEKYIIDYSKCIFCGNCMFYCPRNSMQMTSFFELATSCKSDLCAELINKRR